MSFQRDFNHSETAGGQKSGSGPAENGAGFALPELAECMTNASIDSMVALDAGLCIVAWNAVTARWTGLRFTEVAGKKLFDLFPQAHRIEGLAAALQAGLLGYASFVPLGENAYLPGHYELHVVPLRDSQGAVLGVLQLLHDTAHRQKAEEKLRQLNSELSRQYTALQQASEELAGFAGVAAQGLKEPLRKIYSLVEAIMINEAGKLSNAGRSNFRRIQTSVQRMGLLADDIVNFAGLGQCQEPEPVDMAELLDGELQSRRAEIEQTGTALRIAPLPVVTGHREALRQLFRQLLSNALKFRRPTGSPLVSIECSQVDGAETGVREAQPNGRYWHLQVADNGIGFDPAEAPGIFGLFRRLHGDGSYRGSGMGLAVARKAVQLHNGFIRAESTPGEGSVFHCYLPC